MPRNDRAAVRSGCLPRERPEPLTHLPPLGSRRRQRRRRAAPLGLLHPPTRRPGQPRRKMLPGARLAALSARGGDRPWPLPQAAQPPQPGRRPEKPGWRRAGLRRGWGGLGGGGCSSGTHAHLGCLPAAGLGWRWVRGKALRRASDQMRRPRFDTSRCVFRMLGEMQGTELGRWRGDPRFSLARQPSAPFLCFLA